MLLYVIRHAIAEDQMPGESDTNRELTDDGAKVMKHAVRGMRALGWRFDRLIASPWTRARQTAKLVAPLCESDLITTDLLSQSPRAELLAMIGENVGGEATAIVGHEPWLGELVSWLAFGDQRHGEALRLKKAGAVVLSGTAIPGGMEILALLPPKVLRSIE
ncbi:MAG: histidine phosphatase family protein [Proteobacteria bacterium]|nr:histidine phosphatase family protein [Pseudomonadota bacterium]